LKAVSILAGCLVLTACASDVPVVSTGERYVVSGDPGQYKLGPGDRIRVTVFNEPTLTGEFQVSTEGKLALPLVGEIDAAGKSAAQIAQLDQARLAGGYLQTPRVSAEVVLYRPFFILGEVTQGGQYPYLPGLTVMGAVATARGFTPRSQRKVVYIRHEGDQAEVAYRLTPNLRVFPGDTIRIEERWF
jgi:polysaccharide biosynthesis/export protein